jgi:EAL domain-containing protein (putative c-di-GMP-specific phosphodiesterase class I)
MNAIAAQSAVASTASDQAEHHRGEARVPLCYVIDADASIRHFLSLILHGSGIETEEFANGHGLTAALAQRTPDVVFLNIALDSTEAMECVTTLGKRGFSGYVQLMSNRGSAVLAHVNSIGEQHHVIMLPPLKKPFDTGVIVKILQELKLGEPPALAGRIDLDEALQNNWIEFWYQPKIDLRKKQLVGVEAFARARHPQNGVLMPEAFIPGATTSSIAALSELALSRALQASLNFAKVGINIRPAVNVPLQALAGLAVADIVSTYHSKFEKWSGLIIDVPEEQIVADLSLALDLAHKLAPFDVKLAVDNFGRSYSALARLRELPFAEFKLDRAFVTDCSSNRANASLCKTVINLAHNFGSIAVAIGIEKAADALALMSMGCDFGQGFLLGQPMPEERFTSLLRQRAAPTNKA